MSADRLSDMVGRPGGPLADAAFWHLEVTEASALSPNMRRLVLSAPGLGGLRYRAGQDLMLRVPLDGESTTNRRYTVRSFDPITPAVTLDVSLHGTGPGTEWVRAAEAGDHIEAIGPRGKITVHDDAAWHLFVADETGMPGALAMMDTLEKGSTATALLEVDSPADEQGSETDGVHWLHRNGRSVPGDPAMLCAAAADWPIPAGVGHVYVAAERGVVRAVEKVLRERGLDPAQISTKAYWRRDRPNADHGEPGRED